MATYNLTNSIPSISNLEIGDILNCSYSGTYKQITLPKGQYKLECWGASCSYNHAGTNTYNGRGGYSVGTINLSKKTKIYLYVGQEGPTNAIAFNGGGYAASNYSGRAGGGASDIRIGTDSLYARVIVAGGGGGGASGYGYGGYGGGETGGQGYVSSYPSTGGTQTAGGKNSQSPSAAGSFGQGGTGGASYNMGSGGGGWYGGAGGYFSAGGGGSGYVYTSSTASNYPSGCLLNSSYYLTDASTIAGSTSFTSPSGSSETGHAGDGYIRITILQIEKAGIYIKIPSEVQLPSSYTPLEYIKTTGTQYINTGFTSNSNTKIKMEVSFSNVSSGNSNLWCSRKTNNSQTFTCFYIGGQGFRSDYNTTMYSTSKKCAINEKVLVTQDKNNFYLNNSLIHAHTAATFNCPYPMLLLASHQNGATSNLNNYHQGNVYYCKIYDNGTLIRDFIPVKRNSDSALGLYDLINNKFYTNAGTGTFIAGPEKSPWKKGKNIYIKVDGEWIKGDL